MDTKRLLALFWLSALACGRRTDDARHTGRRNVTAAETPTAAGHAVDLSPRSYGFKGPKADGPTASSKFVEQTIREPVDDAGDLSDPEKSEFGSPPDETMMDSLEGLDGPDNLEGRPGDDEGGGGGGSGSVGDFEHVKKVKEMSSVVSLRPKERDRALDPISDQQGRVPTRFVRPLRDLSIIVRKPHHPILIARQVPVHWIPIVPHRHHHPHHHHHHHPHHHPQQPHKPAMPKHKPCKPCKPKKKHPHKPKKPKKKPKKPKKPKKDHCHHHHHHPKKPHHKNLMYYAPMPAAMNNYYYGSRRPAASVEQIDGYAVEESPEHHGDVDADAEKPFHQEIEEDVEEHRLTELSEPFGEGEPSESEG